MSTWIMLSVGYCRHCNEHRGQHARDKCLYHPTQYAHGACAACGVEVTLGNVGWVEGSRPYATMTGCNKCYVKDWMML